MNGLLEAIINIHLNLVQFSIGFLPGEFQFKRN